MTSEKRDDPASVFLRQLKDGEQDAWSQLYRDFAERLYTMIRKQVNSDLDAEDILGDIWLTLPKAIKNFDGQISLVTFIYSCANRKLMDFWRVQKDVRSQSSKVVLAGPKDGGEISAALQHLSEQERKAIILRYQLGHSVDEIASELGRTTKATESLLNRAHKRLESGLAITPKEDYMTRFIANRHPDMDRSLMPIVLDIYIQQRKCESAGHDAEAEIFERSVAALKRLTQVQTLVGITAEE